MALYRKFWYLKCNIKNTIGIIVFDSDITYIDEGLFIVFGQQIWK